MKKALSYIGFICYLLYSITVVRVLGQENQSSLPLNESENKEENIRGGEESYYLQPGQQDEIKISPKHHEIQLKREKVKDPDGNEKNISKEERSKSTILKSSSSLVSVFYVLVSYLFSGPLDSSSSGNLAL